MQFENLPKPLATFIKSTLKNLTVPMDYDKAYGAQCVDLIRYYLAFLGLNQISTKPSGGAADLCRNCPLSMKITGIRSANPGDIFVMARSSKLRFGHTGIVLSHPDANGMVETLEANWDAKAKNPPRILRKNIASFSCLIRPPKLSSPRSNTANQLVSGETKVALWKALRLANIRSKPTVSSPITGSRLLLPGNIFRGYADTFTGQSVRGNAKWVKSLKGNFIWSGNLIKIK